MPRSAAVTVENSFVKGLVTEASGLNFPENAVTDTENCVFDLTGSVTRRLGIEYESNFQAAAVTYNDVVIEEYLWRSVTQTGEKTFLVVQIGAIVSLYEMDTDQTLSSHEAFNFDLSDHTISGAQPPQGIAASFASGNGLLFIVHPSCQPMYVERSTGGVFTVTDIEVKIRDVFGLDNKDSFGELLDIQTRPSAVQLSPAVHYNLKNQGWDTEWYIGDSPHVYSTGPSSVLDYFFTFVGQYPAESESWFEYKVPMSGLSTAGTALTPGNSTVFSGSEATAQKPRNTPAAKGHYTFDAFNIDRSAVSGVPNIAIESSDGLRPSVIAFYAGRAFYAGVNTTGYNTKIFFSQIIQNKRHIGDCFQAQDPTQEDGGDIVASDGGWITIPDIGRVVKMVQEGEALFIVATNGTWKLAGSQGVGFTATDYSISKVSETGADSPRSFVLVEGTPIWWNVDGIWAIQSQNGMDKVISMSKTTIASFLLDIPPANVAYVKGAYNPLTRVVQWLFRSTASTSMTENFQYDRILNLDMNLNAYYPWTLPNGTLKVVGLINIAGPTSDVQDEVVTDNLDNYITNDALAVVEIENIVTVETSSHFKYITVDTSGLVTTAGTPGTTYDSAYIGSLDSTFSAAKNNGDNFQTVLYGQDGLIYTVQSDGAVTNKDNFVTFDPNTNAVSSVTFDEAASQAAIDAALATSIGTWNAGHTILPFPYSPYYYVFMTAAPGGADTNAALALYRIDPLGHTFLGVWGFTANFRYFQITFHATGYYGQGFQPETNNLLVAATHESVLSGSWCDVLFLPSVNDFLAGFDLLGQPLYDEAAWVGMIDTFVGHEATESGMFDPVNEQTGVSSGTVLGSTTFFLPVQYSDGSWGSTVNSMIPKAVIDYYKANTTSTGATWCTKLNTIIQALSSTDYGIIVTRDLGLPPSVDFLGGSASQDVAPTNRDFFKNVNIGSPFGDENKERDGSASTTNDGRWMAPSLMYVDSLYILTYVRRYAATIDNLTPTGTYHKVAVFNYAPSTQSVTVIGTTTSGNTYDVVSDLGIGSGSRYAYCPTNVFIFWNTDASILFIFNHNFDFGTDDKTVISQFGTFVVPTTGSANLSFSAFNNDSYLDWESVGGGTDFSSYLVSGYKLRGQAMKRFQNNYIDLYVHNDAANVFDFQSRWDYSTANTTGRWSGIQRINLSAGSYTFKRRRLLLRGTGLASQFSITSVTGQPFNLIGWAVFESGNQGI